MVERSLYPRMAIVLLAIAGVFDSIYLTISGFQREVSMACPITGEGCTLVRDSPWSTIPPGYGIPVAMIGVAGYIVVALLAMRALHSDHLGRLSMPLVLASVGTLGMLFSLYLIVVQVFIIQSVCSWCMLSSLLMLSIWATALYDWRTWRSRAASEAAAAAAEKEEQKPAGRRKRAARHAR